MAASSSSFFALTLPPIFLTRFCRFFASTLATAAAARFAQPARSSSGAAGAGGAAAALADGPRARGAGGGASALASSLSQTTVTKFISCLAASVFPAPDSPVTSTHWSSPSLTMAL